jgi:hypothetical protein
MAVRKATPEAKSYEMADGGGMYLEVMPTGSKYWRFKYRFDGKEKRLAQYCACPAPLWDISIRALGYLTPVGKQPQG